MSVGPTQIRTRRLVLREPAVRDIPAIVRGLGNWNVACWLGRVPHPYGPRHARTWLERYWRLRAAGSDMSLAIALTLKPDRMIGMIGCHKVDGPQPEIGYWLAEPYWGRGYVSEAAKAMLDALLQFKPDARPISSAMLENEGSIRVLEKAGFRRGRRTIAYNVARKRKVAVAYFTYPMPKSDKVASTKDASKVK